MNTINCKHCGSTKCVKNGKVRLQQRYKCKECSCNFILGDKREKLSPAARSLAILLYGRGKSSYGFIAKGCYDFRPDLDALYIYTGSSQAEMKKKRYC